MNEQIRSILAQETTKTSKIRQLYLLGVKSGVGLPIIVRSLSVILPLPSTSANFKSPGVTEPTELIGEKRMSSRITQPFRC